MELRNPGLVQAVPDLKRPAQELAQTIKGWPNVTAFTHWRLGLPGVVDGADFHVGDLELGHIHLDGTVHSPSTRAIAAALVQKGLGRTPSWSDEWITCPVRSSADASHAAWLFGLSHAHIEGSSDAEVMELITNKGSTTRPEASVPPTLPHTPDQRGWRD